MSPREFLTWLRTASPGDMVVYHTGHFSSAAYSSKETERFGVLLHNLYDQGVIDLTQRRKGNMNCDYLARKRNATARRTEELKHILALLKLEDI